MKSGITYTAARAKFAALCDKAAESREPIIIHRRGAEDVAIVSAAELESLTETAHLLRSPRNAKRLLKALDRARRRQGTSQTVRQLRKSVGLDRPKR